MKITTFILAAAISFTAVVAHAGDSRLDKVVELLQKAKTTDKPLALLEEAKQTLSKYTPNPETIARRARVKAALKHDAKEDKQKAMERVGDCIALARSGADAKSKISAAIASVHSLDATTR